jgi:hypothetical protein
MQFVTLPSPHADVVHDLAFDAHGRRLATCAADKAIKVRPSAYLSVTAAASVIVVPILLLVTCL